MKHSTMSTTENPSLSDELANLEAELADLNDRRVDLYRRSLQAAQDEKACGDLVSRHVNRVFLI